MKSNRFSFVLFFSCYAVEHHFQGAEYHFFTFALFASARPLKLAENARLLHNGIITKKCNCYLLINPEILIEKFC